MMEGVVTDSMEAVVRLRLTGTNGREQNIDAVVDTGFTGTLTIPMSVVAALGLKKRGGTSAVLADGSSLKFGVYTLELLWNGIEREIAAYAVGDQPLIGMRLLHGHELFIDVESGGRVQIKPRI